jgi:bifunctional DNA-binding transcriptional regulator/antitoxin component of YhaV-PrlF toxin-antitoxin module
MSWIQSTTLKELQSFGSFKDVRNTIQDYLGERLKLKARGWKNLLEVVEHIRSLTIPSESISTGDSLYFKSEAARIIYALVKLDGEQRLRELKIDRSYYRDSEKAKKWRNEIAKLIHPDRCNHPQSAVATNKLSEIFNSMIGK